MAGTPALSPWPAPTLGDAAPSSPPPPPALSSTVPPIREAAPRRPVTTLIETARRWTSKSERAEHAALKEEQRIRAELLDLPVGWFVLHAEEATTFPELEGGADHVAIGPGGVFLIHLEHRLGAKVWISEHRLTINGRDSDRLATVRSQARRSSGLLTSAIGRNVTAQAVVVLIGAATMQMLSTPAEVHVRDQHDLRDWLCRQPPRLEAGTVTALREYLPSPEPAAPDYAQIGRAHV